MVTFTFHCPDCDRQIGTVDVEFGRPAPPCSNPSDPRYADSGEPAYWEFTDLENTNDHHCDGCCYAWSQADVWRQARAEAERGAEPW